MKISKTISAAWKSVMDTMQKHPTAIVILMYCFVVSLCISFQIDNKWVKPFFVAPYCIVASLVIEFWIKNGRLWALLLLPPFFASLLIPHMSSWIEDLSYLITTVVVLPSVLLLYKRSCDNIEFIKHATWALWSLILPFVISSIVAILLAGICLSIDELFSKDLIDNWPGLYLGFPYILVFPMLFITFMEKEDVPSIKKWIEVLFNWVISPALVIYSVVLLIYVASIVYHWSLPCGGVALMCFIWGIFAFMVSSVHPILEKHPFAWFDKVYKYLSIPFVVLLWISIITRVGEYGITPARYFLILCGILMTTFIVISFLRERNLYYWVTAIAAVLFLLSVYVPGINYQSVTIASQLNRFGKFKEQLNIPDGWTYKKDSTIQDKKTETIILQARGAERLIREYDKKAEEHLGGVTFEEYHFDVKKESYEVHLFPDHGKDMEIDAEGFSRYLFVNGWCYGVDENEQYVEVKGRKINSQQVFESKLKELGAPERVTEWFLDRHNSELLVWDVDDWRIILRALSVEMYDSGKKPRVTSFEVEGILVR